MKQLPESETYEAGLAYWPYKTSLQAVLDCVVEHAPRNGRLLDIMCGPGYLLGKIAEKKRHLSLHGVDIDGRYVLYGNETYPSVSFELGDVLKWQPESRFTRFDMVLCTGALHHVPYDEQEAAVANIASLVNPEGLVIISDCYIGDYTNEVERKLGAAKLGYEYLVATIQNGAPDPVVDWTVDVLSNDVLKHEFKTSLVKRMPTLNKHFNNVSTIRTWPEAESGYGDYYHICTGPRI